MTTQSNSPKGGGRVIIGDYNELIDGLRRMLLDQWPVKLVWSCLSTVLAFLVGRPDEV